MMKNLTITQALQHIETHGKLPSGWRDTVKWAVYLMFGDDIRRCARDWADHRTTGLDWIGRSISLKEYVTKDGSPRLTAWFKLLVDAEFMEDLNQDTATLKDFSNFVYVLDHEARIEQAGDAFSEWWEREQSTWHSLD
jgi:hypothetical protein